ncbi:alpha-mannosidase [Leifsonia sp. Root112D2]|uniref:alpha-mannosidase n=1 Tax=Leifsonia sp. Root112D2 TaxID=1736426 RepID=UPI0006F28AF0|nr:glycoside hydrolase family 38 C-terminal domain-containing protein [Leifsonia sp. Root112D2]KQV05222.1 alpha-mannosidase [Leifsonia sp. Root112D2]
MHDDSALAELRIARFVRERLVAALYRDTHAVELTAWAAPGEPVSFADAVQASFEPFAVGDAWGVPWGTVWFRVRGEVPAEWALEGTRPELVLDLGFSDSAPGFQAEATAWTPEGTIVKAVEPRNPYVPVGAPGASVDLYIEAAANPEVAGAWTFAPTELGDPETAGTALAYRMRRLELALLDETVWELLQDIRTLTGLVGELPAGLPRRAQILRALERVVDEMDPDDVAGTAGAGRAALAEVLASPAYASAHRLSAVGHAHIDSAWLWPVRETVRKVARTFSNVLALMDEDPDFVFAASSAQQYAWLKQYYPELYARVAERVAEGRFVPVGGMWVESDTNLPGGEAMARQFIMGKRFFLDEFGVEPEEVWLPDSFGYSAALPQIVAAAGSRWFLTQKISWNETNRMPHHTFMWEGIDGTRIFTHFPPVDTYNSELSALELARAERQYAEKGAANSSLVPFGFGDGGGGPTREMLAAARRAHDLEGSPRVELSSPRAFFEAAEAEYASPPVWSGELYLEFHRGTYTSQARTKRGNRRSEHLLREAELWAATAAVRRGDAYPYEELDAVWQTVLLQQFHDILPGSSIAWVYQEAERAYAEVAETLEARIASSLASLTGPGETDMMVNAGPYARDGIPALGAVAVDTNAAPAEVGTVREIDGYFVLENSRVRARLDARGLLVSAIDLASGREAIPEDAPANLLQLFRDTPRQWDAWDIDEEDKRTVRELTDAESIQIAQTGDAVVIVRTTGDSRIEQRVSLHTESGAIDIRTRVDWHEKQKLLKLAFPLDVRAERAASEVQFGHVFRPTHMNTSWDAARFETAAHRWVHVGEPGFGVAIANDASYGHDIRSTALASGGTATVVRVSLLRAPLFPDPDADQGEHEFTVSLRVGADIAEAVAQGYRLNLPLRRLRGAVAIDPLLSVDNPAVVVEAVKLAGDRSGDMVVRLYEAFGTRARVAVVPGFAWTAVSETDLLERDSGPRAMTLTSADAVSLLLRPFQLVTLRFARS